MADRLHLLPFSLLDVEALCRQHLQREMLSLFKQMALCPQEIFPKGTGCPLHGHRPGNEHEYVVWSKGTKDVWVHLDFATVVRFFDIS